MNYREIQQIAKTTMQDARDTIRPGMALAEVRALCEQKMLELGADSFWYWDVGAFCFSGEDTTVSISGREYQTPSAVIQPDDLVTIDLSPQAGNLWGDYARTIVVEDGKPVQNPEDIRNPEWRDGLRTEEKLHAELRRFARPGTTFEELYRYFNRLIQDWCYINLDFAGNLGHSIAQKKEERIYLEKGNHAPLSACHFFTFEPHISRPGSHYGFKMENIYYFDREELKEL